jgi:hypothetical protein
MSSPRVGVVYVAYYLPPTAQISQGKLQSLYSVYPIEEVISPNREQADHIQSQTNRIAPTQRPSTQPQTMIDRNTFPT